MTGRIFKINSVCPDSVLLVPPQKKFFRRKSARDLLPAKPVEISVEPWWVAQTGFITEDDIRVRTEEGRNQSWYLWPTGKICEKCLVSLTCLRSARRRRRNPLTRWSIPALNWPDPWSTTWCWVSQNSTANANKIKSDRITFTHLSSPEV